MQFLVENIIPGTVASHNKSNNTMNFSAPQAQQRASKTSYNINSTYRFFTNYADVAKSLKKALDG